MKEVSPEKIVATLIKATNAFDVEAALTLFSPNAVIDDVSVGEKFKKNAGVRKYLEHYFVGYKTVTKLMSLEIISKKKAHAHVDFKGDFGHETGSLIISFDPEGLIIAIDAYLD